VDPNTNPNTDPNPNPKLDPKSKPNPNLPIHRSVDPQYFYAYYMFDVHIHISAFYRRLFFIVQRLQ